MNILFASGEFSAQNLRMASFDRGKDSLEIDFIKSVVFDIVPEFLGHVVETGIDLHRREGTFPGAGSLRVSILP